MPLKLVVALLTRPKAFRRHQYHLLDAYGEGMVDEPSNVPERWVGDDYGSLRRLPVEEVVTLIDVVRNNGVSGLFQCRNKASVPGARLPYLTFPKFHVKQ